MSSPAEFLERAGGAGWGGLDRFLRERLCLRLEGLRGGQLRLQDGLGERLLGESDTLLRPALRVHEPAFYRALAANGSVGAGESFFF